MYFGKKAIIRMTPTPLCRTFKKNYYILFKSECVIVALNDLRRGGQIRMADAIRQGINAQACLDEEEEYALMSAEVQDFHDQCNGDESAWDDVKGVPLNPKAVKQTRKEEMTNVRKMRIYDRIKCSSIIAAGHNIIKVR